MIITRGDLKFDTVEGDGFAVEETLDRNLYRIDPKPGMNILDIGAYKGFVSIPAAKAGAYVRSYEPRPSSFQKLVENAALNDAQIDARNAGVWSCERDTISLDNNYGTEEEVTKHGSRGQDGGCPVQCATSRNEGSGPAVHLVSFAEALGDLHWDIVKMDCEGSEFAILYNATDAQLRQIDFITMEVHGWLGAGRIGDMLTRLRKIFDVEGQNEQIYGNLENGNFYLRRKK
jgi:FkbM family methyltransferase